MTRPNSTNKSSSREVRNELSLGGQFHFISIQNPDDANDRKARRVARSHAVAQGLEKKRKLQQELGHNFRAVSLKDGSDRPTSKTKRSQTRVASPFSLSADTLDPFQMLAAESPKLRALHSQRKIFATLRTTRHRLTWDASDKAQHAAEPVFSSSDELVLQNFRSVLRKGLHDHALLSAFMLTFAFAVTASSIDRDYLGYRGEALSSIRQSMNSPDRATSESTLGAILLLAGIEVYNPSLSHVPKLCRHAAATKADIFMLQARLGMPRQVQLHMGAIQQLLDICRRKGVYLSDGIKRAIFWQDLNASVLTGSSRVVDHTTFSELQWRRDPFSPGFFILPPGFHAQSYLLGEEFVEVLKDITALQCIRDSTFFGKEDVISMAHIDNHQASIQSRLVGLAAHSSISECCHLAAYLCSAMLRCKIWRASTIPSHLSLQLLCKLQQANNDLVWDDQPDLLAWLLHIGGAFAPSGTIRSGYVVLLYLNRSTRFRGLYTSWPELLAILKKFIWSEKAFMSQVKAFWKEISGQTIS